MEHKGFLIDAFERGPGCWYAKVARVDGSSFTHQGKPHDRYDTVEYPNSESAVTAATIDIDLCSIRW
jgi:hypothetical protein